MLKYLDVGLAMTKWRKQLGKNKTPESSSLRGLPGDFTEWVIVDAKPKQTKNQLMILMLSKKQEDEVCDATEA